MKRRPTTGEAVEKKTDYLARLSVTPTLRKSFDAIVGKAREKDSEVHEALLKFGLRFVQEHGFGTLRGVLYGEKTLAVLPPPEEAHGRDHARPPAQPKA